MLRRASDLRNPNSLASRMRQQRFVFFTALIDRLPRPITILDLGGIPQFWMNAGMAEQPDIHITTVNLDAHHPSRFGVTSIVADARHLPQFQDGQYDIVFSNSTIEHVGSFADQQAMAAEVRRIGKHCFVQTPNLYFPIEPHFLFPFFQFLPVPTRIWLLQHWGSGRSGKIADYHKARDIVCEIRLLDLREMRALFPDAQFYKERFAGLVKSITAYRFSATSGTKS